MSNITNIGSSIRQMRKKNGITLQVLAQDTGLSIGYLSNLERNISSPTLENLQKICEVLHTSVGDLLERTAEERVIIRSNERENKAYPEEHLQTEDMDFGEGYPLFEYRELGAFGGTSMSWKHGFDEFGYVLSGEMDIQIADETYSLQTGDMVVVKANTLHSIANSKAEPCKTFWCRMRTNGKSARQKKRPTAAKKAELDGDDGASQASATEQPA